jgi:NAD(P)-dependent dehydrogenase (short-subunit alcohol dehydrogenase family)
MSVSTGKSRAGKPMPSSVSRIPPSASPIPPSGSRLPPAAPSRWLAGKLVVVTGASRGIGAATGAAVAAAGAHVVLAARDGQALEDVACQIREAGGQATAVPTDVSDETAVGRLFAEAAATGQLAALVCAAGVLTAAPFAGTTSALWDEHLGVNLTGTFLCCRAAFTAMAAAGEGRIVTIGSLSGVYATEKFPGLAAYNVSKYGVIGLTEAIAVEGKERGISAVCVSPGAVDTEMLRRANPSLRPGLTPEDMADLIVALLDSPMAAVSGANIPLFSNA